MWPTTFLLLTLVLAGIAASGWTGAFTQVFVWSAAGAFVLFVVSIVVARSREAHEKGTASPVEGAHRSPGAPGAHRE